MVSLTTRLEAKSEAAAALPPFSIGAVCAAGGGGVSCEEAVSGPPTSGRAVCAAAHAAGEASDAALAAKVDVLAVEADASASSAGLYLSPLHSQVLTRSSRHAQLHTCHTLPASGSFICARTFRRIHLDCILIAS